MAREARFIQISDLHLMNNPEGKLLEVNTQESLKAVLQDIKQDQDKVDFFLLSGDLSQDGSKESYQRLAEIMQGVIMPIYWFPGNHDNVENANTIYPFKNIKNDKHVVLNHWQLIFLNSQKPGKVEGFLDEKEFEHLKNCLRMYPNHHAIICLHHQPTPVGSAWLDKLGLTNADTFWEILAQYKNIHTVLFGHVHQEFAKKINTIPTYSVPSTCIQFMRHQDHFGLENLPQGYRIVELHDDGRLQTKIKRLPKYIGVFDAKAKGY